MRHAWFVRTWGLTLALGLGGIAGGCGPGPSAEPGMNVKQKDDTELRQGKREMYEAKKAAAGKGKRLKGR